MLLSLNVINTELEARLLIEPEVIQHLAKFRQLEAKTPESGGILMGYRKAPHIHITEFSQPDKGDTQTRFSFLRDAKRHHDLAIRRWAETKETLDYLGEWHTHPEDHPIPSQIDLKSWTDISKIRTMPMIFIIIGRKSNWIGLGLSGEIKQVPNQSIKSIN